MKRPTIYPGWLKFLAGFTFASALILIAVGASVTTTGSGDAVPDWPLSYGSLTPPMIGGIRYEHTHRLVAGFTAFLIGLLCIFSWWKTRSRELRLLSTLAFAAVLFQALLGGIRVLVISSDWVQLTALRLTGATYVESVRVLIALAHAYLAELVVGLVFTYLYFSTRTRLHTRLIAPSHQEQQKIRRSSWILIALLSLQLVLGALVRHTNAGLVIPDFPLAFGKLIPPFARFHTPEAISFWDDGLFRVSVHFTHRVTALLVTGFLLFTAWRFRRNPHVAVLLWSAVGVALLQILLGGWIIWSARSLASTIAHVVNGTMLFACGVLYLFRGLWGLEAPRGNGQGRKHLSGVQKVAVRSRASS